MIRSLLSSVFFLALTFVAGLAFGYAHPTARPLATQAPALVSSVDDVEVECMTCSTAIDILAGDTPANTAPLCDVTVGKLDALLACLCAPLSPCSSNLCTSTPSIDTACKVYAITDCYDLFYTCADDDGGITSPPNVCDLDACPVNAVASDCNGDGACPGVVYYDDGFGGMSTDDDLCRVCCPVVGEVGAISYCVPAP